MAVLLTIGCLAAVAALVLAEYAGSRLPGTFLRLRSRAKITASACFVLVGAIHLWTGEAPEHLGMARGLALGLVLGAVGDVLLLRSGVRAFIGGLVAFLCGHLAYIVGMALVIDPRYWLALAGWIGIAPVIIGSYVYELVKPNLGKLKLAVGTYILVIVTMTVAAIALARSGLLSDGPSVCLGLGACLFLASDFAVARERFLARDVRNKLLGLPAYYVGQLLIAWSIG